MADVAKITLPNGTTKDIKDTTARKQANWNTNNGVKNLLDVTYNTYTNNECSYVKNADGSITLNGKVNGFFLYFSEGSFYNPDGYHTFSFGTKLPEGTVLAYDILNFVDEETGEEWWDTQRNDISSGETTIYEAKFSFLSIEFPYAAVFNNITLYPTYSQSQEAIPYFKIQDTKVTELVSEGANLIPYPINPKTINGITFTPQALSMERLLQMQSTIILNKVEDILI